MEEATGPRPEDDRGIERAPEPPRKNGHDGERPRRRWRDGRLGRWRREHPRGALVIVVLVLLLIVAVIVIWWYLATFESTDNAQIDGHISPVSTRVAGTVTRVFVEDNQRVVAGQLLAQLDPADYKVALARAEAELQRAQATLEAAHPSVPITSTTTQTAVATTEQEVATAEAAVAAAERDAQAARARVQAALATAERAKSDLDRQQYLFRQKAIPRERLDAAVATYKAARADVASQRALARAANKAVEQQKARLEQAESRQREAQKNAPRQVNVQKAQIDAQQAAVRAAAAAVERARLDLSYTRIVAPIAGIVGKRSVEPGQRVQPGEQLVAIVDLDHVWVTANFKETQMEVLRVGQSARIHVDALDEDLRGKIVSFPGATGARYSLLPPENATGNWVKVVQRLPVRIALAPGQDPHDRLRLGMSVEARVRVR